MYFFHLKTLNELLPFFTGEPQAPTQVGLVSEASAQWLQVGWQPGFDGSGADRIRFELEIRAADPRTGGERSPVFDDDGRDGDGKQFLHLVDHPGNATVVNSVGNCDFRFKMSCLSYPIDF